MMLYTMQSEASTILAGHLRLWKGCETMCPVKEKYQRIRRGLSYDSCLIKNLEKKFGECIQDVWSHKTPAMPKFLIVRPTVDNKKMSSKEQRE